MIIDVQGIIFDLYESMSNEEFLDWVQQDLLLHEKADKDEILEFLKKDLLEFQMYEKLQILTDNNL